MEICLETDANVLDEEKLFLCKTFVIILTVQTQKLHCIEVSKEDQFLITQLSFFFFYSLVFVLEDITLWSHRVISKQQMFKLLRKTNRHILKYF